MNKIQQQEKCSICEQHPEDILMLECAHDICVACAAQIYSKKKKNNIFTCEICLTQTSLDKDTVSFLENTIQQNRRINDNDNRIQKLPNIPKPIKNYESRADRSVCLEHKEQATYYCFDCHTADICAECILSETHRNHHLNTLKKAVSIFTKNIETDLRQKEIIRSKISNNKRRLVQMKVNLSNQIQQKTKEIKLYFEEIISKITICQNRLLQELTQLGQQSHNKLKSYITRMDIKCKEVEEEIQRTSSFLKGKPTEIFKFKSNLIEYKPDKTQLVNINFEITKSDLIEELELLLKKIQLKKTSINVKPQGPKEVEQISNNDLSRRTALKRSFMMESSTPAKPQMVRSLNLASDIINKLQSRQRDFE